MRIITLFNEHSNSTYSLNVLAQLARKGKSVLYIDLRLLKQKPVKQKVGHDISLFFSSHSKSLDYFAVQYEKNLHVVNGNSSVFEKEFSNYSSLFTFTVFESATQLTQYDYIVFGVDPEEGDATLSTSSEVKAIGKDGEIVAREIFRGSYGSLLGELFSESEPFRTPIEEVGIEEFGEPRRIGSRSCYVAVKDGGADLIERVPLFFALPLREGETADQRIRAALTWLALNRLASQEADGA